MQHSVTKIKVYLERIRYLGECRQVEMFVWQIEHDTSVDRFMRVNEQGGVLHGWPVRLDHNLHKPNNKLKCTNRRDYIHNPSL